MPRRDPVQRVRVVGDVDVPIRQLLAKSYRPGTRRPQGHRKRSDLLGEIRGGGDERLPEALAAGCVESRKNLTAASVEHGQASGAPFPRHGRQRRTGAGRLLGEGAPECVQGADASHGQAGTGRQAAGGGKADSDADEGPRPPPHGNPSHLLPTTGRLRRALHLGEQGGRVLRASVGGQTERRLVQHLAIAHRADGGVGSRRVEPDDRLFINPQLSQ